MQSGHEATLATITHNSQLENLILVPSTCMNQRYRFDATRNRVLSSCNDLALGLSHAPASEVGTENDAIDICDFGVSFTLSLFSLILCAKSDLSI